MQEVNFQSVSKENSLKGPREDPHAISKGQAVFSREPEEGMEKQL